VLGEFNSIVQLNYNFVQMIFFGVLPLETNSPFCCNVYEPLITWSRVQDRVSIMPPLHNAFQISEILSIILENFYDESCYSIDYSSLASMAETCKLFSAPALAILWRHLDSLIPLLTVIPCFMHGVRRILATGDGSNLLDFRIFMMLSILQIG